MPSKGSRLDDRRDKDGELWPGVNAKPVALRRSVTASPAHSDTWDNRRPLFFGNTFFCSIPVP